MKAFIKDTLFDCYNINRRDNCSKKKCCKQCRQFKFKGTMTKWSKEKQTQNSSKHTEQQDVTDIQNILFCVLDFSIFIVYFRVLKMNSPRNVELLFMFC